MFLYVKIKLFILHPSTKVVKLFVLSKQNLDLSTAEALALIKPKSYTLLGNLLIVNTKRDLSNRLAYTKQINKVLFISTPNTLEKDIKSFKWKKMYIRDYSVRTHNLNERKMAGLIWDALLCQNIKPHVNLKKPKQIIEVFKEKGKVMVTIQETIINQGFEKRKPHKRPEYTPISLHPKLARCLINLTGIQRGTLLDPFCGTGGILIEAGLMNLTLLGIDISKRMINTSKINLTHYKIKNYKLFQQDATKIKTKYNYIVADLPYGLNTIKETNLYNLFLKTLRNILKKTAVLTFPNKIPRNLIKKHNLKIQQEFSYYIHKSLTKKIVVLS